MATQSQEESAHCGWEGGHLTFAQAQPFAAGRCHGSDTQQNTDHFKCVLNDKTRNIQVLLYSSGSLRSQEARVLGHWEMVEIFKRWRCVGGVRTLGAHP